MELMGSENALPAKVKTTSYASTERSPEDGRVAKGTVRQAAVTKEELKIVLEPKDDSSQSQARSLSSGQN